MGYHRGVVTPEQLAQYTQVVVDDAIEDGRADMAAKIMLEAFADAQLAAGLSPEWAIQRTLKLWQLSASEAKRAHAGLVQWLQTHHEQDQLESWARGWLALQSRLASLPEQFPAPILAIVAESLCASELVELRPRLRRWAWANPELAKLGRTLLPEPDPLAELWGRTGNSLLDLIGEALAVSQRGSRPLPVDQAIARARTLLQSAEGEHDQTVAWRGLHDLLLEQTLETSAAVVEAVEPLLADWPDSVRATLCASPWDFDIVTGVEDPAHRLIRTLDYSWIFVSRAGKIMMRNPRLDARDGLGLAHSPSVKWLTRIKLSQQPLGPEVARALARSQLFVDLQRLDLGGCDLQTDGVVALARGHFPALTHVVLSSNDAGPAAAQAWSQFGELTLLDLGKNPIGEGVASLGNATIAELDLSECNLPAASLPDFAASKLILDRNPLGPELQVRGPRLRELSLCEVGLGDRGIAGLALPELDAIRLEGNDISASGLERTSVSAATWQLSNNPIGDAGLLAVLGKPACRQVIARNCGLSSESLEGAELERIELLDLLGNQLEQVRSLARARALRELTVGGISLADIGADWPVLESLSVFAPLADDGLPATLPSRQLWLDESHLDDSLLLALLGNRDWQPQQLSIAATSGIGDDLRAFGRLTDAGLIALANSPAAERLTRLRLPGHHKITSEGLQALARSPRLAKLERLDIGHCSIDDSGVLEFLRSRPQVLLDVEGNPYGEAAAAALESAQHKC